MMHLNMIITIYSRTGGGYLDGSLMRDALSQILQKLFRRYIWRGRL